MPGRIMRSADFELVLSSPAKARSAHFAAHHVSVAPSRAGSVRIGPGAPKLSTMNPEHYTQLVDENAQMPLTAHLLGVVIPKRNARLAATRNLLRRQIRAAILRHEPRLARGLWLVRLRAPFARADFPSATSPALRRAARDELNGLFTRASY